ncbi:MAG: ABC transporter permease, partial [Tannerella sp.]|nr:ABC transporter permease [Tannerella sp.]
MLKRNIKLYFRDRTNMFFSMLSVFIIVALFALFLGQGNWGSDEIRDSWLMAGVLAVATVTTALGAFSIMVEDKVDKITKGFYASPIKRSHIAAAYIFSPFVVSVIMTIITAVAFGGYIMATGGAMPGILGTLLLLGLILLSSISST